MQMDEQQRRARVLNLLRVTRGKTFGTKAGAVRQLLTRWPDARGVRFEGKCPICRKAFLLSFITAADYVNAQGRQECGYFCAQCRWANAGSREGRG